MKGTITTILNRTKTHLLNKSLPRATIAHVQTQVCYNTQPTKCHIDADHYFSGFGRVEDILSTNNKPTLATQPTPPPQSTSPTQQPLNNNNNTITTKLTTNDANLHTCEAAIETTPNSFYRRPLPENLVAFSSPEGT